LGPVKVWAPSVGERCLHRQVGREQTDHAAGHLSSALGSPRSSPETEPVARIASVRSPRCAAELDDDASIAGALLVEINDEMIAAERRYIAAASTTTSSPTPTSTAKTAAS
jgi:hypothetical protein